MRRMNSSAARTTPTDTATTMSKTTVSAKQVTRTSTSLPGATRSTCATCLASDMFHATSSSSAASAAIGRRPISGASTMTATSTVSAWTIAATGDRPPDRKFVAVRAMAPVAGMPPKNGVTTLPTPSAISSASGSCRVPAIPSAITADSSDSIPPSMATANAPDDRSRSVCHDSVSAPPPGPAARHGSIGNGGSDGTPCTTWPPTTAWNRLAIVATA